MACPRSNNIHTTWMAENGKSRYMHKKKREKVSEKFPEWSDNIHSQDIERMSDVAIVHRLSTPIIQLISLILPLRYFRRQRRKTIPTDVSVIWMDEAPNKRSYRTSADMTTGKPLNAARIPPGIHPPHLKALVR